LQEVVKHYLNAFVAGRTIGIINDYAFLPIKEAYYGQLSDTDNLINEGSFQGKYNAAVSQLLNTCANS
jgi:hypothetical protein